MLNNIGTILHHNIVQGGDKMYHEEYIPSSNPIRCRTRTGQRFNSSIVKNGQSNFYQYASVTLSQLGQVSFTLLGAGVHTFMSNLWI
jgi:hypothetical protein